MIFKKLISISLITASVFTFNPKKAEAFVVLAGGASIAVSAHFGINAAMNLFIPAIATPIATVGSIAGGIVAIFNPTVGIIIISLGEDGSLTQNELEQLLTAKYAFVQDPMVISDLAAMIKSKAEGLTPVEGKIIVSLSEEEVMAVISGTDLLETHEAEVKQMIQDLI